uniref:Uncharacterized protein n=1 Tax=Anguilla anguilla TaxID=7936 RepID=A0A0E9X687_ANGAN
MKRIFLCPLLILKSNDTGCGKPLCGVLSVTVRSRDRCSQMCLAPSGVHFCSRVSIIFPVIILAHSVTEQWSTDFCSIPDIPWLNRVKGLSEENHSAWGSFVPSLASRPRI